MKMFAILFSLLFGSLCQAQDAGNKGKFEVYIYIDSLDVDTTISADHFEKDFISYYILRKKMPREDFDYSLEEVFQNKISKVKRRVWQNNPYNYISFLYEPEQNLEIRRIRKSSLKERNVIHTGDINNIQFKSLEEILKKADKIFVIVEAWNDLKSRKTKAFQVKLVEPQGGM